MGYRSSYDETGINLASTQQPTTNISDRCSNMVKPIIPIPTQITKYADKFILSEESIMEVMQKFQYNLDNGLTTESNVVMKSSLKMLPTFLHDIPNCSQKGCYVALDLGGTNLRFFKIILQGDKYSFSSNHHPVPESCMHGSKDDLFDFLAKILKEGLEESNMDNEHIPFIGFTFSFPVLQTSLCSGSLICWSKGFETSGVVGEDVAKLMKQAANKIGLNIDDFVLINDTTGTLLSGALLDPHCAIGVINGTGTNACYIEDLERVAKWNGSDLSPHQILINTEWGAFGAYGELTFIQTEYDIQLDSKSMRPGHHLFEKMISGMYLGEIVRLTMIQLAKDGIIFGGKLPDVFSEPHSLDTRYLSDAYDLPKMVNAYMNDFNISLCKDDAEIISSLSDLVIYRSAQLISSAISVLLNRINRNTCTIAVDGSLFKKNPFYLNYVNKTIKHLVKGKRFVVINADDGSGKGAALAAAVASRSHQNNSLEAPISY